MDQEHIEIVAEDNCDMLGTYAMMDPQGRVYTNMNGRYEYSSQSATEVGFGTAWEEVNGGFSTAGFTRRGGLWNWRKTSRGRRRLPVIQGDSS